MPRRPTLLLLSCLTLLAGCDYLGIEAASVVHERRMAEGRAIGAACRHAGRAIEDCYALNRRAEKAAVFAGWREMNDYMTENAIAVVPPQDVGAGGAAVATTRDDAGGAETPARQGAGS